MPRAFSFSVDVLSVADEENNERSILEIADDAVVPHTKTVLADGSANERLGEFQRILLGAAPVEFRDESPLRVPRELL